jgi:hypothetical protein
MKQALIPMAALLLAATAAFAPAAFAHDSWFETRPGKPGKPGVSGEVALALGTGNQFPKYETGIGAEYLAAQGCVAADGATVQAMKPQGNDDSALLLRAPRGAVSCWMQLQPFEVTVAPDKVPLYLKEIQASPEIRATWAAMQARGLPWRERYVKHARIDIGAGLLEPASQPATTRSTTPPLGMDLRIERDSAAPLRVGSSVRAQVLRDGVPLANQALEFRSDVSPLGIWRRSDADGRVTLPLPLAGNWVLRGVDLRVSSSKPDEWDSRFVTLAFAVLPAAAANQNGSSFKLNARSTNQAAAMAAISSEPPSSTTRR